MIEFGRERIAGTVVWQFDLLESPSVEPSDEELASVKKIWVDGVLVYWDDTPE